MSKHRDDIALLRKALEKIREEPNVRAHEYAREPFEDMLIKLETVAYDSLTDAQRAWVKRILDEPEYENLISSGKAPRGREVPTPAVLQNRPLKPPGRR